MAESPGFVERLNFVLGERRKHPWGRRLGIPAATVTAMFRGAIPSWESLIPVQHVENVSLSWLLEGTGAPFLVVSCDSDADCGAELEARLSDRPGADVHVVSDGGRTALVLHEPAEWQRGDTVVRYRAIDVLAGAGARTLERLSREIDERAVYRVVLDAESAKRLCYGYLGAYELFGDERRTGRLEAAERIHRPRELRTRAAEAPAAAEAPGAGDTLLRSEEEQALLTDFRAIDPAAREQIRALARLLRKRPS